MEKFKFLDLGHPGMFGPIALVVLAILLAIVVTKTNLLDTDELSAQASEESCAHDQGHMSEAEITRMTRESAERTFKWSVEDKVATYSLEEMRTPTFENDIRSMLEENHIYHTSLHALATDGSRIIIDVGPRKFFVYELIIIRGHTSK